MTYNIFIIYHIHYLINKSKMLIFAYNSSRRKKYINLRLVFCHRFINYFILLCYQIMLRAVTKKKIINQLENLN